MWKFMANRLLLLCFLPLLQSQAPPRFRNESSLNAHRKQARAKRQYQSGLGPSSCGGCLSKFTPVNCKCTATATDDLLCRCDRAILANVRDDPDRPQCPCSRRGVDSSFRGEINELTSKVQNLGNGIHSACHPICHQSCLNSCTRPLPRDIDSYRERDRYGAPYASDHEEQQNPPQKMANPQQYPVEQLPGCQPSQCRMNCLRACSRILDGQREGAGEYGGMEKAQAPYQENLGSEPPHYEVRPADPFAGGKLPPPSEYGRGSLERSAPASSCQCSSVNFCDCPEACFPLCFDSCESNCNNNAQASHSQRRMCTQTCHFECQRNCAEKQRQKQLGAANGGNEAGGASLLGSNNGGWPVPSSSSVDGPSTVAENNAINTENAVSASTGGESPPSSNCMAKCPKSCETACSMAMQQQTGEDPTSCMPACVAVCAQSCSRGLVQMDHGQQFGEQPQQVLQQQQMGEQFARQLGQPMAAFGLDLRALRQPNGTNNELMREGSQKGEKSTPNMSGAAQPQMPTTMFQNDGRPVSFAGLNGLSFSQPCAPLCQPECKPECNMRYMEMRRPTAPPADRHRPYRGIGGNQQGGQMPFSFGAGMQPNAMQRGTSGQQQNPERSQSKQQHSLFPPHYILPLADDLDSVNATVDDFDFELAGNEQIGSARDEPSLKGMEDVEFLLRPQNETGQPGNSTASNSAKKTNENMPDEKQQTMKPLALAKPWRGKPGADKQRAEDFFKRRMGKFMKGTGMAQKKSKVPMPPQETMAIDALEGKGESQPKFNF